MKRHSDTTQTGSSMQNAFYRSLWSRARETVDSHGKLPRSVAAIDDYVTKIISLVP